jgi:DedD protein
MPELANTPVETVVNNPVITNTVSQQQEAENIAVVTPQSAVETVSDNQVSDAEKPLTEPEVIKKTENKPVKAAEIKVAVKTPEASKNQIQTPIKPQESFTVQVGVYSDADNVKRLQEQLKQAGFSTHTEKVKTPKGDSLRLKAGNFNSRQDAVAALDKIKAIGLPGIVVGNE